MTDRFSRRRASPSPQPVLPCPSSTLPCATPGNPAPATLPAGPHESVQGATMSEPTPPTMAYWHVYTDADGVSRQTKCELTRFKFEGVDPQTAPQWNDKQEKAPSPSPSPSCRRLGRRMARESAPAMDRHPLRPLVRGDHGRHPRRDGTGRIDDGRGSGHPRARRQEGHLSGTVGDEPCAMIVTGLDVTPTINQPGRFK